MEPICHSKFRLNNDERIDDLVRGGLKIIQSTNTFCFSMDAVLLSNFASVKKDDKAIDLGTGTGVIPLLLSTRQRFRKIVGLEIQSESVDQARRSIKGNDLDQLIEIVHGDIRQVKDLFNAGSFDLVTSNPPYMPVGRGEQNNVDAIAIARHEILCNLKDVVAAASRLVKYGGRFAMVHRPERLTDIIAEMLSHNLLPSRMQFVFSRIDRPPIMVMIEARLGGNPELKVLEPAIVYDQNGNYSKAFWEIYYPEITYPNKTS